jgi:hypothetical protein
MVCACNESVTVQISASGWSLSPVYTITEYFPDDDKTLTVTIQPNQGIKISASTSFFLQFTDPVIGEETIFVYSNIFQSAVTPVLDLSKFGELTFKNIPAAAGGFNTILTLEVYERI